MDIQHMIAELIDERNSIEEAILVLERMASGQGKRRGRPPLWLAAAKAVSADQPELPKRRGRPPGSKSKPKVAE